MEIKIMPSRLHGMFVELRGRPDTLKNRMTSKLPQRWNVATSLYHRTASFISHYMFVLFRRFVWNSFFFSPRGSQFVTRGAVAISNTTVISHTCRERLEVFDGVVGAKTHNRRDCIKYLTSMNPCIVI